MRRLVAAALIAATLTACGSDGPDQTPITEPTTGQGIPYARVGSVVIEGRPLLCAGFLGPRQGGLSCNWEAWNNHE